MGTYPSANGIRNLNGTRPNWLLKPLERFLIVNCHPNVSAGGAFQHIVPDDFDVAGFKMLFAARAAVARHFVPRRETKPHAS